MLDLAAKRVMVTGGSGFLGGFVLEKLKARGCESVFAPRSHEFDLTRASDIARALSVFEPQVIVHLAAVVGGIGANLDEPGRFFYENAVMGIELIEQSRRAGVEKFVCVGTVCAYPKFAQVPFTEDGIWDGYPEETNAPYGIAKKAMLVQLQAYRQQYGMNGIFLLPANLYGPEDNFDLRTSHVIPAMIRKFIEARDSGQPSVTLWGTGSPSREFLFAEDAAEGIVLAAERYDGPEPVNLGAGFEITIRDLAEKIASATDFTGDIVWDDSMPDGQPRRSLDTRRARESFGFQAAVGLDEGLRRTIDWFEGVRSEALDRKKPAISPHTLGVEKILDGDRIMAIVLRGSMRDPGVAFFSPPEFSQQLGFINHPAGHVVAPHIHNPVSREIVYTEETLFVREGRIRVDIYRADRTLLTSRTLTGGDVVLLASGGHGLEVLEPSSIIEVKQGPYAGESDKTRFEVKS